MRGAAFTFFRSDNDNAVGAPRAVNGRRRNVFQHLDGLNITGVDSGKRIQSAVDSAETCPGRAVIVVKNKSVNHIERFISTGDRVPATDTDTRSSARLSRTLRNVQPGHRPAQRLVERGCNLRQCPLGNGRSRSREFLPFLRPIADNHHTVEKINIFLQENRDWFGRFVHVQEYGFVSDKTYRNGSGKRNGSNCKFPVDIHNSACFFVSKKNICTDNRLIGSLIPNISADFNVLSERPFRNCGK